MDEYTLNIIDLLEDLASVAEKDSTYELTAATAQLLLDHIHEMQETVTELERISARCSTLEANLKTYKKEVEYSSGELRAYYRITELLCAARKDS